MDKLTNEQRAALEEHSAGEVPWKIIEKIPKKFEDDALPTVLVEFGGTLLAKTVIDGETVWAVVSKRRGKYYYISYADTLEILLAGL